MLITEKSSQNKSNMSWQRVELPFLWSPDVWWDLPGHNKGMEETVIWYFLILGELLGWSLYSNDSLDLFSQGFDMERRRKKSNWSCVGHLWEQPRGDAEVLQHGSHGDVASKGRRGTTSLSEIKNLGKIRVFSHCKGESGPNSHELVGLFWNL